jgi:hypothetical protein
MAIIGSIFTAAELKARNPPEAGSTPGTNFSRDPESSKAGSKDSQDT